MTQQEQQHSNCTTAYVVGPWSDDHGDLAECNVIGEPLFQLASSAATAGASPGAGFRMTAS